MEVVSAIEAEVVVASTIVAVTATEWTDVEAETEECAITSIRGLTTAAAETAR